MLYKSFDDTYVISTLLTVRAILWFIEGFRFERGYLKRGYLGIMERLLCPHSVFLEVMQA